MLKYTKSDQDTEMVTVGDIVMSDMTGLSFRVAGVDGESVLRAEDAAWLPIEDVTLLYPAKGRELSA